MRGGGSDHRASRVSRGPSHTAPHSSVAFTPRKSPRRGGRSCPQSTAEGAEAQRGQAVHPRPRSRPQSRRSRGRSLPSRAAASSPREPPSPIAPPSPTPCHVDTRLKLGLWPLVPHICFLGTGLLPSGKGPLEGLRLRARSHSKEGPPGALAGQTPQHLETPGLRPSRTGSQPAPSQGHRHAPTCPHQTLHPSWARGGAGGTEAPPSLRPADPTGEHRLPTDA